MGLLTTSISFLYHCIRGRNHVRIIGNGNLHINKNVTLRSSRIYVYPEASLTIEDGCRLDGVSISIVRGNCTLGYKNILQGVSINIEDGSMCVGHHSKLACKRIWVRFGGQLRIGEYTNINDGSEIRCDEMVSIGSFNQISYNVRIWDTNTHNILPPESRRKLTIEKYPYFGFEKNRPVTSPVSIGNDCWIGENCTILKGSNIGDKCIVGFGTLIVGKTLYPQTRAVNEIKLKISPL